MKTLEDAVAATADRRRELAKIEQQIVVEQHAIAIARQEIERHHMAASALGDAHAFSIVQKARLQQREAEQRLAAIFNNRWPAAKLALDTAEAAERHGQRAANAPHREAKQRERLAIAARIDQGLAEVAADCELYLRLGLELSDDLPQGMMSAYEDVQGLKRLADAMPARLKTLPPANPEKFVPLGVSEARFWNLPPTQEAAAA